MSRETKSIIQIFNIILFILLCITVTIATYFAKRYESQMSAVSTSLTQEEIQKLTKLVDNFTGFDFSVTLAKIDDVKGEALNYLTEDFANIYYDTYPLAETEMTIMDCHYDVKNIGFIKQGNKYEVVVYGINTYTGVEYPYTGVFSINSDMKIESYIRLEHKTFIP